MSCMAKNIPPKKEVKEIRLTIRLSKDEKALIARLRALLSSRSRVKLSETQTVVSGLRIADEVLNEQKKHPA